MADEKRKMTKNTMLMMPAKVVEGVLLMAINALYSNWTTLEANGKYQAANTNVLVLFLITGAWLYNAAARFVADYDGEEGKKTFFSTFMLSYGAVTAAVMAAAAVLWGVSGNLIYLANGLMLSTYSLLTTSNGLLIQTGRIKASIGVSLLSVTAKILCAFGLLKLTGAADSPYPLIFAAVLSDILVCSLALGVLRAPRYTRLSGFSRRLLGDLLRFGVPLIGMSIGVGLLSMIDRYIVKAVMNDAAMGVYITVQAVSSGIFNMISASTVRITYPALIAGYNHGGREEAEELLSQGVRLYLLIALPAALGLLAVCHPLAEFMYQKSVYHENAIIIGLVALGFLMMGLTEYAAKGYELTKNTRPVLYCSLAAAAVKIAVTIFLVSQMGIVGAAWGTLLSFTFYFFLVVFSMRDTFTFRLQKHSTLRIFTAAACCAGAAFLVSRFAPGGALVRLAISVAAGGAVYVAVLLFTNELAPELAMIRAARGRKS
ncbi:lipopolysaccharide biosynthesis protein [Acidaminobacterium chupaoyuni]